MARGVCEKARVVRIRLMIELCRAKGENCFLSDVEILDPQVQVELHR